MSSPVSVCHVAAMILLVALSASNPAPAAQPVSGPIVSTTAGRVIGTSGAILTFKGIPYAAPPIGALRWRAPRPPHPWKGVRSATHFGNDCMQTPYVIPTGQKPSEDCLTVNVWTAAHAPGAHLPVMVFIYGGAFIGGSCAYPLYDGTKFAAQGVVFVCFNYRVGIFGFLAHPMLSAESSRHSSGNYGLLDQIAALKWVRANIASFGGDPNRVTVFGESAGAVSIAILLASPLAHGLFTQAIMESPSVPWLASLATAEKSGAAIGANLAALRRMSAAQLLGHNGDFFPRSSGAIMSFPAPIIDGYVVPVQPRSAYSTGRVNAVRTIVGINADEGRMFTSQASVHQYRAWVRKKFGSLAGEMLRLNPAASNAAATAATSKILGDAIFDESARLIARGISRQQPKTFAYVFTRSIAGGPLPPTHSEELPFVFGSLDEPSFIKHPTPDRTDLELSATLMRTWARFAASGDPNGSGLARWPAYDRATDSYLAFGTRIHAGRDWHKAQLDVLESFYADNRP